MQNPIDVTSLLLQILSLEILFKDYNNSDLMQELQTQDEKYLKKIIEQNKEIILLLRKEDKMEDKELNKKLKEEVHKLKEQIATQGIQNTNIEFLYKLVDIEKDLCEIEKGGESMNYNAYGRYDDYGRYGRDEYGRDEYGRRGRYRGHDYMDSMYNEYGRYEEGREQYNRGGSYNAKEDSIQSLEKMLQYNVDLIKMLKDKAQSQEEMNIINKYVHKISEM